MGCGGSKASDPHALAAEGSVAALAQWIDSGGHVDAVDTLKGRGSLLQAAASRDQVECIKLLLKCGANVNLATPEHGTALHAAASAGAGNAVPLLLANGASTSVQLRGLTAAELAEWEGSPATANLIRMTQADLPERASSALTQRSSSSMQHQAAAVAARATASQGERATLVAEQHEEMVRQLQEIQKQLSAVDSECHVPGMSLDSTCRSASAPTSGNGALPSPLSHLYSMHPLQHHVSPSFGAGSIRLPRQQPSAVMQAAAQQHATPTDAELQELQNRAQQQGAYGHVTPPPSSNHSNHSGRIGGGHSSAREVLPPLPLSPATTQQAVGPSADGAAAGAANGQALVAGGSFGGSEWLASLPRINSSENMAGSEEELDMGSGNGSGSHESRAMLSKQPSGWSTTSHFANVTVATDSVAAQAQVQPEGATMQHAAGRVQAAAGPALARVPSTHLQSALPALQPAPRNSSANIMGHPSIGSSLATPHTQPSRGNGSLSLSVDIRPWEISFEDLALQKTIGEGSFGKVYVAKWHETLVAVKVLSDLEEAQKVVGPDAAWTLSNPILFNLQKECGLMASLRHPNVVQFMGVSAMPPAIITEYCAKGSLADVLKAGSVLTQKASQLTWLRRLNMALDATKGMLYLHKRGIIHRDLKSPNLLVESTWKVKVSDFNLSKIVEDTGNGRSTIANMNPRWLAPEILNGEPATTASDVFSWGVVMWELLTFQLPWPHVSPWALVGKLMDGMRLKIPPKEELPGVDTPHFVCLDEYIALMERCWAQAPEDRPDFEEVIHELRKMLAVQARSMEK